jgi:hypothetical protein
VATHDYLGHWRICVAVWLTMILLGMGLAAVESLKGRQLRAPVWLFAFLPPLGFIVQEHLERAIGGGSLGGLPLEPVFLLGLVLQIPFALAAFVIARSLLALAASVVRALRGERPRLIPVLPAFVPVGAGGMRRLAPLALGYAERGPPAFRL